MSNILISERFQDWCLYDKNGVACCTKKLDLFNSWLDAGYLDQSPFVNFIDLFDRDESRDWWGNIKRQGCKMNREKLRIAIAKEIAISQLTQFVFLSAGRNRTIT